MDTTEYMDVFIDESKEHMEALYKHLLELEKNPSQKEIIEEIFRSAHTLKGMSATMGYKDLASLTHKLENVFDGIRYDKITVKTDMMDVMFEAVDQLNAMVEDIASGGAGHRDVSQTVNSLEKIENGEQSMVIKKPLVTKTTNTLQTIAALDEFEISILNESTERGFMNYEITVELREDCLLKGARVYMVFEVLGKLGEVIRSEPSVNDLEEENFENSFTVLLVSKYDQAEIQGKVNKVSEIENVRVNNFSIEAYKEEQNNQEKNKVDQVAAKELDTTKQETNSPGQPAKSTASKTIRVNIDRLDVLMNLFEELVIDRGRLEQISADLNHHELDETVEHMSRVSSDLQNIILNMRMVPVDNVFNRFPRMIRQLAKDLHKKVEIKIVGAETELDRTVIDEIGDPLVHLIRNAMDHGIETPEERIKKGKTEQGTIKLEAYTSGNHVFIEITDDGAGINKEKVLNKAISKGIISENQAASLTERQIFELIMESGFSTADKISDISGRGVGLDVVKNTIESLGGTITIDSTIEKGSHFSVQLPLTLSIISVLLVELNDEKYAIPLSSIIETTIIHKDQIMHAHTKKVIDFRGKIVPLVFLKDIYQVPYETENDTDFESIVIVRKGEKMTGLVVDSFIGQQEVVLKTLGNYLTNVFSISGATILGDGQVALIIDGNALIK